MTTTYRFGLIGHQISYSRSQDVFNAIFDVIGATGKFMVVDIPPPQFHGRFIQLVKEGLNGLSVTIPYKRLVIQHLHEVDTVARVLDAVNSIACDSGRLCGYNTDGYGFTLPLAGYSDKLKQGSALILGCGGAARAAVYSLYTDFELNSYVVLGRTEDKLAKFTRLLERQLRRAKIVTVTRDDFTHRRSRDRFDIIVNGTPLGGWNYPDETPLPDNFTWSPGKVYYDVNYNADNKLVRQARDAGLTAIDGSTMLVGQAIRSFSLWTGRTVPFEPVYQQVFGDV